MQPITHRADYIERWGSRSDSIQMCFQTSVDAGSSSVNTLYNLLLIAGPIFLSVRAPFLLADF